MWGGGGDFYKKLNFQTEKKTFVSIVTLKFFSFFYCSIVVKRQTEQSELRPDTCSLIVPTFDTKVTEYLCSGGYFFFRQFSNF